MAMAQISRPVEPVISGDYQLQLQQQRLLLKGLNAPAGPLNDTLLLTGQFQPWLAVGRIRQPGDGTVKIIPGHSRTLLISGVYNASATLKRAIRLPDLQHEYVQGRPVNDVAVWRGPETNERFSYGPALSTLEFDGSAYDYDQKGKLVAAGTGNGTPAAAYDNGMLRNAAGISHMLTVQAEWRRDNATQWKGAFSVKQARDNSILRENLNKTGAVNASLSYLTGRFTLTGAYTFSRHRFSNSNRTGFLNRVYSESLLTPVSFNNEQGAYLATGQQRSYSNQANNPWFMLQDSDNKYQWTQQTGSFRLYYKDRQLQMATVQSLLAVEQHDREVYKSGSAGWPSGMLTDRLKRTFDYTLKSDINYSLNRGYRSDFNITANYLYQYEHTNIGYMPDKRSYLYYRSSHDLVLGVNAKHNYSGVHLSANAGNKLYLSNTAVQQHFFLPTAGFRVGLPSIAYQWRLEISAAYCQTAGELPLHQSLASASLPGYSLQEAMLYRPVLEIDSYKDLLPARHAEWTAVMELGYSRFSLRGNFYVRQSRDEPYAFYNSGRLVLQNIAGVQKKGMEWVLNFPEKYYYKPFGISNTFSFSMYRNTVTEVKEGYNYMPTGGFAEVHTALVKRRPLGAIVGDGYIGDPNPDFSLKWNHMLRWKKWSFYIDAEWKKGGEAWNGTQAMLDYYGRSAASARNRNVDLPLEQNPRVQNGPGGIAANYIQRTDYIKISNLQLVYKLNVRGFKDRLQLCSYIHNLLLWWPYRGGDPAQLLFDQLNTIGMDYFNLPATVTYGCSVTLKF